MDGTQTTIALTLGLVVFLLVTLMFTSTAGAAIKFRCTFNFGECAEDSFKEREEETAPVEFVKKQVEIKTGDSTDLVDRETIPDMTGTSGEETFALLVNKEWKLYPDTTTLIQNQQNNIEIIRRKNDPRFCRVTLTIGNSNQTSLYREATPVMETFGYTKDCESVFILDFKQLKTVYDNNPSSIFMDVIVFKPGVGDEGIGNPDKWAASVKMPIRVTE